MGLTGVITARHAAHDPGRDRLGPRRHRAASATSGALTAAMRESDDDWTYSVAWVDTVSRGRALGPVGAVPRRARPRRRARRAPRPHAVPAAGRAAPRPRPPCVPDGLVSRAVGPRVQRGCGSARHPATARASSRRLAAFFHPLDGVGDWNRLYGPSGFVQYQLVVPDAAEDVVHDAVRRLAAGGHASFLAVLKRFGPANDGLLSFPIAGWTLALDLPARPGPRLGARRPRRAGGRGGRPGLPGQGRPAVRPDASPRCIPGADEFARVRDRVDPGRILASDLARRLGL